MADQAPYTVIIEKVDAGRIDEAASSLRKTLGMETEMARTILQSLPLIFIRNLTKADVKGVAPALMEISKSGVEFRITTKTAKLPKLNWPLKPHFLSSNDATAVAFEWNGLGFVCPSCGESFVFKKVGKVQLFEPPVVADAGRADDTKSIRKESTGKIQKQEVEVRHEAPVKKEQPAPVKQQTKTEPKVEVKIEPIEEIEEIPAEPEILEIAESPLESPANPGETKVDEEPVPIEASDNNGSSGGEVVSDSLSDALEIPSAQKTQPQTPTGDTFNVFINKVSNATTKKQVAELMTKYRGCSVQDAVRRLDQSVVIKFAESVSKDQADAISRELKKLQITARILQVKK